MLSSAALLARSILGVYKQQGAITALQGFAHPTETWGCNMWSTVSTSWIASSNNAPAWRSYSTKSTAPAASAQSPSTTNSSATSTSSSIQPEPSASFAAGPRRLNIDRASAGMRRQLSGIVHINTSLNNTLLSLTDTQGVVKTWTSCGTAGYRNARKSLPVATEKAAEELAKRALRMGYSQVVVKIKGVGANKQYAVGSLASTGLTITALQDVTPVPYNGCRRPKRRRV
mmetsp:Transcript_19414/g.42063  ORF Transcript_19414/g.42063 Transcript_19414/m.42063 type:complete len:229 (+) Transcript_19414:105-791(+)